MAAKTVAKKEVGGLTDITDYSCDELRELIVKLRTELDGEHSVIKQLRRENYLQEKKIREEEHNKQSISLKNQKHKLLQEKTKEIESTKKTLVQKCDNDVQKITKQKDSELQKLKSDLKKFQDELSEVNARGLSGAARGAFELERGKLLKEVQELRTSRRKSDETFKELKEANKAQAHELQKERENQNAEITKVRRESDMEFRKLLDELKSKDRTISSLEKDIAARAGGVTTKRLQAMERDTLLALATLKCGDIQVKDAMNSSMSSEEGIEILEPGKPPPPSPNPSLTKEPPGDSKLYLKIAELNTKIRKLEDQCTSLNQDKVDLIKKVKEAEKKQKPLNEKSRKFLEKNMELTNINRSLEEKIKKLTEENSKLKQQCEKKHKEFSKLSEELCFEKLERESYDMFAEEMEELRRENMEYEKTIAALSLSNQEKDRRIELLACRVKKQKSHRAQHKVVRFKLPPKDLSAGIKETYFGYDEDDRSLDSEMSSRLSVDTTIDDDDVFEELTRNEVERNYQRLAREHLELEKAYAIYQSQHGHSHLDPVRESKLRTQLENDLLDSQSRIEDLEKLLAKTGQESSEQKCKTCQDTTWVTEKDQMNKTIRLLKDKLNESDNRVEHDKHQLHEIQEQNEVLEFRVLELEDINEKLHEDVRESVTITVPPKFTEERLLQMVSQERGILEICLEELRERLHDLKYNHDSELNCEEKITLVQAKAVLDVADRKLLENQNTHDALRMRIKKLETEKIELIGPENNISTDLLFEYEETRNTLIDAELRIQTLEKEVEDLRKSEAVYKYKEEHSFKTEETYKTEISNLKRQLSNSVDSRDFESDLFFQKIEQLKTSEQRVLELENEVTKLLAENKDLTEECVHLQEQLKEQKEECADLSEQLNTIQETQSLTESDKDASNVLQDLKAQLNAHQKTEEELQDRNMSLKSQVDHLREKLQDYESIDADIAEENMDLQEELQTLRKRCKVLQDELEETQNELEDTKVKYKTLQVDLDLAQQKVETVTKSPSPDIDQRSQSSDTEVDSSVAKYEREIRDLKQQLVDYEKDLVHSRNDFEVKSKECDEYKFKFEDLEVKVTGMVDLSRVREQLTVKEKYCNELEEKVQKLETAEEESSKKILELSNRIPELENAKAHLEEQLLQATNEVSTYKLKAHDLEQQVTDLTQQLTNISENKENLQPDTSNNNEDLVEVSSLRNKIELLELRLKENENTPGVSAEEATLKSKVVFLENKLKIAREKWIQSQDQLVLLEEEHSRRIENLQDRLHAMEDNEVSLNESISELNEVQDRLKDQMSHDKSADVSLDVDKDKQDLINEIISLKESEQKLLDELNTIKEKSDKMDTHGLQSVTQHPASVESIGDDDKHSAKISQLETRVKELMLKEDQVLEENYQLKLENQELQDQLDEIAEDEEDGSRKSSPRTSKMERFDPEYVEGLNSKIESLEKEKSKLKEDLMHSKLDALDKLDESGEKENIDVNEMQNQIEEHEENEEKLNSKITEQKNLIEELNIELSLKIELEEQMNRKLEVLEQSEDKLMEQVDIFEEENAKLIDEVAKLTRVTQGADELKSQIQHLESQRVSLETEVESMKKETEVNKSNTEETADELQQLREKIEILLDAEERLMDRIQEQEDIEVDLRKHINELEGQLEELEKYKAESHDKVKIIEAIEKSVTVDDSAVFSLADSNKPASTENLSNERVMEVEQKLSQCEQTISELRSQIVEYKMNVETYRHQIKVLESEKATLLSKLSEQEIKMKITPPLDDTLDNIEPIDQVDAVPVQTALTVTNMQTKNLNNSSQDLLSPDQSFAYDVTMSTYHPVDLSQIQGMSRDEMVSKMHELEAMEKFHRTRIAELKENLGYLRQAVEVVAVTMETDADIPVISLHRLQKESEFLKRMQDLSKSETTMKLKVTSLEKENTSLRRQIQDAEGVLKNNKTDCKAEVEQLEEEVIRWRKAHAKLKNQLQYGNYGQENAALAKIQHLESLVYDLENSERKLKRKVQELKDVEQELKYKLEASEKNKNGLSAYSVTALKDLEEKDKYYELLTQVKLLESSEKDLKERLDKTGPQDNSQLVLRIAQLERSEKGLQRKIELLEAHDHSGVYEDFSMLDSPEAILKQRIKELEKMERHLKTQVVELERDREELHEIARKDKNVIHEINVQIRELQLSEKNLKDQLNRCEISENHLHLKLDDMTDRIEELEDLLKKTQSSERTLKVELQKYQHQKSDLDFQLESTVDDMQYSEKKYKKKMDEFEREKMTLKEKIEELTDKVSDLESTELSLKQKLRTAENSEKQLKSQVKELESSDNTSKKRKDDLENINEALNEKLHKLEEEKSNLMYEMSDLGVTRDESITEIEKLKTKNNMLQQRVKDLEEKKKNMDKRLNEFTESEVTMHTRLFESERCEKQLRDKMNSLEKNEAKLRRKIQELEATIATQESIDRANCEREGLQKALTTTRKAHELLKGNYEDAKRQLLDMNKKIERGELLLRDPERSRDQSVQVRLAEVITLRSLTPEFRTAIKDLSSKYPSAYEEFMRNLQPSEKQISHVRVRTPDRLNNEVQSELMAEEYITPQSVPSMHALGTASAQVGRSYIPPTRPLDAANEAERERLIDSLVRKLPEGDIHGTSTEGPLWKSIERRKAEVDQEKGERFWHDVERSKGETDDMTLTVNFGHEPDDHAPDIHITSLRKTRSTTSLMSVESDSSAPPLPTSQPPQMRRSHSPGGDSLYLPSADEVSELGEDPEWKNSIPLRAKSLDRDSDFSEGVSHSSLSTRSRGRGRHLGSWDSMHDSGYQDVDLKILREKIQYLEEQVQSKDRDLEAARYKLADEEGAPTLKAKLKEKERQLEVEQRQNKEKESELKLKTKEIENLKSVVDKPKNVDSGRTAHIAPSEHDNVGYLKAQLDRKEKELQAKSNELDRLLQELRQQQDDVRRSREDKNNSERALLAARSETDLYRDNNQKYKELLDEHNKLKEQHDLLLQKHQSLEEAGEEKSTLEKIVLKLRGQLKDLERIDLERDDLETKVKALEQELKGKAKTESQLSKDNAKMQHHIESLKNENSSLGDMEKDYGTIRSNYEEMERIKKKAQLMITPLRAKVMRLAQLCKNKDDLIQRLLAELRREGCGNVDLLSEADQVIRQGATEEYQRPISPLTTQAIKELEKEIGSVDLPSTHTSNKSSKIPRTSNNPTESLINELLNNSLDGDSDIEALLDTHLGAINGHAPQTANNTFSHNTLPVNNTHSHNATHNTTNSSIDFDLQPPQLSLSPVTQLNNSRPRHKEAPRHSSPKKSVNHKQLNGNTGMYRAIKDYNPEHFSQSGHQRLELPLKEGDTVTVLGAADSQGYHEAECRGRVGLVPASYLQPVYTTDHSTHRRKHKQVVPSHVNTSPEQILHMHQQLNNSHNSQAPFTSYEPARSPRSPTINHPAYSNNKILPRPPVSPRQQGAHPAFSPNNVSPRDGIHKSVSGPVSIASLSPATHNTAPLDRVRSPLQITPLHQGPMEPPTSFKVDRRVSNHSVLVSWVPPTLDEMTRSNGVVVTGYKIYINSKDRQIVPSPYMTKALIEKLNLSRPQSFSIQTLGEQGQISRLCDTMFEDVLHGSRDSLLSDSMDADTSSVVSSMAGEGEKKVFLAIYDYSPSEHSPRDYPDQELGFKTGDMIVTYGNVKPNGFYYAKVHGKKGFVPASFIEEVALLRSRGKRSTTSGSIASLSHLFPPSSATASLVSGERSSRPTSSNSRRTKSSHHGRKSAKV